jgi:hypothetical protein
VSRPFGDWHVVALFNWGDDEKVVSVSWNELGEDPDRRFVAWEFWTDAYLGERKGSLSAAVPPRGVRLFALHEAADHPQFVGDDRHITQGAVELNALEWDAAAKTYTLDAKAVGGFPFTYFVRVPEGFSFKSASAPKGGTVEAKMRDDLLLAVTISATSSQDVKAVLQF